MQGNPLMVRVDRTDAEGKIEQSFALSDSARARLTRASSSRTMSAKSDRSSTPTPAIKPWPAGKAPPLPVPEGEEGQVTPAASASPSSGLEKTASPAAATVKMTVRERVIQEILSTERTFVGHLRTFIDVHIRSFELRNTPLKTEFMDQGKIALIFSNVEQICALNSQLLAALEQRIATGGAVELADVFLNFAPLFELYGQYTSNHDQATERAFGGGRGCGAWVVDSVCLDWVCVVCVCYWRSGGVACCTTLLRRSTCCECRVNCVSGVSLSVSVSLCVSLCVSVYLSL